MNENIRSLIEQHHTAMKKRIDEVDNRLTDAMLEASRQLDNNPDDPDLKAQYDAINNERQAIIDHQQALKRQLWQTYYALLIQTDPDKVLIDDVAAELYDYYMPNLYNPHGRPEILIPENRKPSSMEKQEAQYPVLVQIRHLRQYIVKLTQDIEYNGKLIPAGTTAKYCDIHAGSDMGFSFKNYAWISETTEIDGVPIFSYLTVDELD